MNKEATVKFYYALPAPPTPPAFNINIGRGLLRATLENVRDQLLVGEINGGPKKLTMDSVCHNNSCGTAACIGGWAAIGLLGTEKHEGATSQLFEHLVVLDEKLYPGRDRLHKLFYGFVKTDDYDEPNVAATAIQRYLDGKTPWPVGKMPDKLRYKYKRKGRPGYAA